jgi:hypothetical protein
MRRHHRYIAPDLWPLPFRLWRSLIIRVNGFTWRKLPHNSWGDWIANTVKFIEQHNRWPRKRMRFNDYFFQIKLRAASDPFRKRITDKIELKEFVREQLGDQYNVPTLALLATEAEVLSHDYPYRCCIKPAHLSQEVIIRKSGETVDCERVSSWLKEDYYFKSREANYRGIPPRVIIEPLVFDEENPKDYKVFCYCGRPKMIQVDIGRHVSHQRALYSVDWVKQPFGLEEPLYAGDIRRPSNLSEMLEISEKLSIGTDLVRVDLYTNGISTYVGEITIVHGSAGQIFDPLDGERIASQIIFGKS